MNKAMEQTLLDLKTRQLAGERLPCPRCGRDTMSGEPIRNALSRYADIYVCDTCGMDEAMLDMMQNPLPLKEWACFKEDHASPEDTSTLTMQALWVRVAQEHIQFLITLYMRWMDEREHEDFDEYRKEAKRKCPGLSEFWDSPFQARYKAIDGEIVVRFKKTADGIKVSGDLIPKRDR